MTKETAEIATESIGNLLRQTRREKRLDLDQICEETKISASNLRAMESDDFAALPADTFARGFYGLYAKRLGLDPEEVISRFKEEKTKQFIDTSSHSGNLATSKDAHKINIMAEPPNAAPLSGFGFLLLLVIIFGAGICWYLDINPATYISEKLRGL